jgi:NADP-dependent 3-hydroxy acid dehydrogenase YdfG
VPEFTTRENRVTIDEFQGRTALVTGASGGLGAAIAGALVEHGYRVALVARNEAKLADLVSQLGGERAMAVAADITSWEAVSSVVQRVESAWGPLDLAVANAGVALSTSFHRETGAPPEEWAAMVSTNVLGTALTARATLPGLTRQTGHLVIIGSISGTVTRPGSLYSVTKWAVTKLAESIRAELAGTGVRVTIVQPGVIDTDILREELRNQPMLTANDVARAIVFAVAQPSGVDVNELVVRPRGALT